MYIIERVQITDLKDKTLISYPSAEIFKGDLNEFKERILDTWITIIQKRFPDYKREMLKVVVSSKNLSEKHIYYVKNITHLVIISFYLLSLHTPNQ